MTAMKRKRPLGDDSEPYDSGDSDSGDDVDISLALAGNKSKKTKHILEIPEDTDANEDSIQDDEDLEDIIKESISKRNVKSGTELLKKTKGKAKITKGEVGGGSFQSMGACYAAFKVLSTYLMSKYRTISVAATVFDSPGLPYPYTHPKIVYPCFAHKSSERPCRHGAYRLWKVSCVSSAFGSTSGWPTLVCVWSASSHSAACARTGSASFESRQGTR